MLIRLLRWLRWLTSFLQRPFGSKKTRSGKTVEVKQVVQSPPELTNADLEYLFTQLLEGVHQARGQQWALQYLQRMEHRITVERWIDWLLVFGEKLLASPAPNHQLAERMLQLGELGIGAIGELSYDIGIRLLTRNLGEQHSVSYRQNVEAPIDEVLPENLDAGNLNEAESETTSPDLPSTPGQELIRTLGEQLWEYDESESEISPPTTLPITPGLDLINSFGEQLWEYEQSDAENTDSEIPSTPEEELIDNLGELVWEYEPENIETTAPELPNPSSEELIHDLGGLSRDFDGQDIEAAAPLEFQSEEGLIHNLGELAWEFTRPDVEETPTPEEITEVASAEEATWDESLAQLEPEVANTLDELLVRLDQSTSLVQQLASGLAVRKPDRAELSAIDKAQEWFYQGLQLAKIGDLSGAIAAYDEAIALKPDACEYWFNRGLTLFHLGHHEDAIASYDEAVAIKPDFYKAWYNQGGILGELGRFEEAIACFDKVIEIQPRYEQAWSSKGLALLRLGLLWEAISSYDQALLIESHDPENWYYRGIALAVGEQNEEAIASYDKAIENYPEYHEAWIDRGVALFNLGRWNEAIASYDKAVEIQPDFYLTWYNRGVALENCGQREAAIASYKKALEINPDFHLAWYNQAVALFYLGRFGEAIAAYDGALNIKVDYWEAWLGRGTAVGDLVATNPAIKSGGYEEKLASYEEGLQYVRPDTHPEGWGRLHLAIGNTHYDQGKRHSTRYYYYWTKAVAEYEQALLTITAEHFPQLHLEVLQSLIKALLGLEQTAKAQELQQQGADLLQRLLSQSTRTEESKKYLALKFTSFNQLAVDIAVQYGDLVEAWEIAEHGKNSCLTWLLVGWSDDIFSPNYRGIQQLLNPTTAIIYWHMSPAALHTFIIKDQAPAPLLMFTPMQEVGAIDELPLPEAIQRLVEFEDWIENWNQQYQEYRSLNQDQTNKNNHSWRVDMTQRLLQLKNILNISTIEQELEDITQLILIPHRDLHRFPLHTLFNISSSTEVWELPKQGFKFTISYLPSVQIGLSLNSENLEQLQEQRLLSIENPNSTGNYPVLKFAKIESEAVSQMFVNRQRIQGLQATKQQVQNALAGNWNILHFTGHATDNFINPKHSELVLAGEDKLTLEEICQIPLGNYRLVTISAYEMAMNLNQTIHTEYVGLVSGFIIRGVPFVVSTLWTVESSATALVMVEFYRRIKPDKSAAAALKEATEWLKELSAIALKKWYEDLINELPQDALRIKAHLATQLYRTSQLPPEQKPYNHPYYWAAFMITSKLN